MDCVFEPKKEKVLKEALKRGQSGTGVNPFLTRASGTSFYNTSPMDLKAIVGDQDNVAMNLEAYVHSFSPNVKDIFDRFKLHAQIDRLADKGLLYLVTEKFSKIDLHPNTVSNTEMGTIFEELIRKFAEQSNETAGDHFTPREVIELMVNLIFAEDDEALSTPGVVRTIYDPTAGTGGMLSVAGEWLHSNPPFGVEWKQSQKAVQKEYEEQGVQRAVWAEAAAHLGWFASVHAASGEEDASAGGWWIAVLHRPE